jgi:Domain of unknown function (DUF4395)
VPTVTEYRAVVDATPAANGIDARGDRAVQSVVGVLLLAAFVFRIPLLVPVVGAVLLVGAALGPRLNPLYVVFVRLVAGRLGPPDEVLAAQTIRRQDTLLAGLCALASLFFLLGVQPLGWLVVVAAGVVAVVAATTRIHLGDQLQRLTTR